MHAVIFDIDGTLLQSAAIDDDLARAVQSRFVDLLDTHIEQSGAFPEIPGALDYLQHHIESSDHAVAYATGGWRASARLKLKAAGFGGLDVPLATADDAMDRKDIMLTALSHLGESFRSITYYGDGPWDKDSSEQLGWSFVPVGARLGGIESYQDLIR